MQGISDRAGGCVAGDQRQGIYRTGETQIAADTERAPAYPVGGGLIPRQEIRELLAAADVLLSLHRAEGFGLPVAEVMQCGGVPVATDYSSTREFLDDTCGCPVHYRLLRTKKDYSLYRKGTIWADPDVEDAADKLRMLYENPAMRRRLGQSAQARIREMLSVVKSGDRIKRRVLGITGSE